MNASQACVCCWYQNFFGPWLPFKICVLLLRNAREMNQCWGQGSMAPGMPTRSQELGRCEGFWKEERELLVIGPMRQRMRTYTNASDTWSTEETRTKCFCLEALHRWSSLSVKSHRHFLSAVFFPASNQFWFAESFLEHSWDQHWYSAIAVWSYAVGRRAAERHFGQTV